MPTYNNEDVCVACGRQARVILGGVPYCLDCYNMLEEEVLGIAHVTNDHAVVVAFDSDGKAVQFAVERMLMPMGARWTARELVGPYDPRSREGYVGIEVCCDLDPYMDQTDALDAIWHKAQQALTDRSTEEHKHQRFANGVYKHRSTIYAKDSGWGRIDEDDQGNMSIIVDGQRYTGEEFLMLMSACVGFDLHWQIHDATDDLPARWRMSEAYSAEE